MYRKECFWRYCVCTAGVGFLGVCGGKVIFEEVLIEFCEVVDSEFVDVFVCDAMFMFDFSCWFDVMFAFFCWVDDFEYGCFSVAANVEKFSVLG